MRRKGGRMTADVMMQIVQWLVPIGGLGSVVAWVVKRDTRKDRAVKEKNDIYKEMYDNLSGTLIDLQNENKKLYRAIARLERAVTRAVTCPHYDGCPMRTELHGPEGDHPAAHADCAAGQHRGKPPDTAGRKHRSRAPQPGEAETADGQRG